ncbi:PREDICTED: LOW QUALITY PROTEIN: non-lysosomal glucosylceramidase-like [Branchiostoma belcheri]|uniref:Non-lysosomal glucosylceramidase n=1 Tax=Branchiostoma belcheri TaxID=7741 RepID=A0A6P4YQQ7_BRABE|nr:PREDICTED: LOW QUALITY PROTEIN: non-lysosomal glucosylceramidase-like [Branchiostoma belcheri]
MGTRQELLSGGPEVRKLEKLFQSGAGVPDQGWRIPLDHEFPRRNMKPNAKPRFKQFKDLYGVFYRYFVWWIKKKSSHKKPVIDNLNPVQLQQIYGVPLGGLGCGSICRGWKGDFCRWALLPGIYSYDIKMANQFTVCIRRRGQTTYQQVLSTRHPSCLTEWNWSYSPAHAYYHALYPRAWTVYDLPGQNITLTCRQVSPVLPHDYKDSSLPAAVFVWTAENHGKEEVDISLMFTFQNSIGAETDLSGGHWNEPFSVNEEGVHPVSGILLHHQHKTMPCTIALGIPHKDGIRVTGSTSFNPAGSGKEIWRDLMSDGELGSPEAPTNKTVKGEALAGAVCASFKLPAGGKQDTEFALAWDMPVIKFGGSCRTYKRWYTRWFGEDGTAAPRLAAHALSHYTEWERTIEEWQRPVLDNQSYPDWYRSALFNELYYMSDGGTIWLVAEDSSDGHVENNLPPWLRQKTPAHIMEYGRFGYLEGHEYRMYNTYDVHHYASFALAMLWPQLEYSIQYDYALTILEEDRSWQPELWHGGWMHRKAINAVPHDLGDPFDEPFVHVNAYMIHDTSDWRDLNLKFVLQVFRDYFVGRDKDFLAFMWPRAQAVMTKALTWDTDEDGMIDNSGAADQTYDAWIVTGASAYCGGLWLAALRCMVEISHILGKEEEEQHYLAVMQRAKTAYEEKLWNGEYYNYDCSGRSYSNSIMAGAGSGHWYIRACGLVPEDNEVMDSDREVLPLDHVASSLRKVYDFNVMQFHQGTMGAVNGMRPSGKKDLTSMQSEEVWTGITYALAASMIQEGMLEEGFQTAYGVYNMCYRQCGFAFQTPEAYLEKDFYRSLGYMRPLAIWAMQWALEGRHRARVTSS